MRLSAARRDEKVGDKRPTNPADLSAVIAMVADADDWPRGKRGARCWGPR